MVKESINRLTAGPDTATLEQDQVLLNMSDPETRALQAAVLERISKK
jgi:hypothetical protein